MRITRREDCLHNAFNEGENTFGVYLATDVSDEELEQAMYEWACSNNLVSMNFRFTLSDCVEDMIDFHRLNNTDGLFMEEEDRPMIEALHAELLALASRLQSIRFVPNQLPTKQPEE
jgi:hypothetical protein